MQTVRLGPVGEVSRLTLGGGGIGQAWGETSREEAIATVRMAVESGITLLDTAPMYRNCEAVIAETFAGKLPAGVRITSKCRLGSPSADQIRSRLAESVDKSLTAMRLDHIDVFFLHTNICADDYLFAVRPDRQDVFATRWSLYTGHFIAAMEALKATGKIGHWGITGVGTPQAVIAALAHQPRPAVVQAIANLLDSAGGMKNFAEPERPRAIIEAAVAHGVGVMGIRAVQAGALTAQIDRTLPAEQADARDYERAAPYRTLCARLGLDPALVAHRYALSIPGVDTLILGVKNRKELTDCLAAEASGALDPALLAEIDALGLKPA